VIGAGAARRASAVRWGIAGDVAIAWVITIPASGLVAALFYWLISAEFVRFAIVVAVIAVLAYAARLMNERLGAANRPDIRLTRD
jgi:PiT family inorganic phosphate transporter